MGHTIAHSTNCNSKGTSRATINPNPVWAISREAPQKLVALRDTMAAHNHFLLCRKFASALAFMLVVMSCPLETDAAACGAHGSVMNSFLFYDAISKAFSSVTYTTTWGDPLVLTITTGSRCRNIKFKLTNKSWFFPVRLSKLDDALTAANWIISCKAGAETQGGWKVVNGIEYNFDVVEAACR